MGEFEAIGDVVSGAVLAQAVEPDTGAVARDGHTHEAACLNCGTLLAGDYCHSCGQRGHVHRTLSAFFHDLLHGVFHFEGKIWTTLPLLAWHPGDLTRRYIAGERAKFVSPMALFLFAMFLMFAVLGATAKVGSIDQSKVRREMGNSVRKDEARLAQLTLDRAAAVKAGGPVAQLDSQLSELHDEIRLERAMAEKGVVSGGAARVSDDVPAWLRTPMERAGKNPDLLLFKLKSNAYKWSWALIPISVPFLWLLFPFSRRFRLYDHMVFVTYSLSFMTLLVCVAALAVAANIPAVMAAAMLFVPFHMYRQLRGAYGLGRASGVARTLALIFIATLALGMFGASMIALGLLD